MLIIASFALQFFTPTTGVETPEGDTLTVAESTISALQTQMALAKETPAISLPTATPSTPIQQITPTATVALPPTPASTATSIPTVPISMEPEEFCVNFSMVSVREGPDSSYRQMAILENRKNLSDPVCLGFDFRMPDNSWARIAPDQENSEYHQYESGWLLANQLRPPDIEVLQVFIPDGVKNGKYCVMNRHGVNIRTCSEDNCSIAGTLTMRDCVIIDGRSEDSQWIRISRDQEESKYTPFGGYWISSYFMAPFGLSLQYNPYLQYYLELLKIVSAIPTPSG